MAETSTDSERIIQVMPEALANKIAAGEVVQRPASVLKELVENALDAGADDIEVHLKEAGSDLVQVVDNGSGMAAEDAEMCFKRHATSKIQSVEDLNRIQTLGFRGEALASIAAVARVTLKTKRSEDSAGTLVRVEGGAIKQSQPCAAPEGTSVAVRSLFYNVPARRNFLKTPATELKHLVETFQFLALSNPEAAFRLTHNGNTMYRLPVPKADDRVASLRQRIGALFDEEYPTNLLQVRQQMSYLSAHGFVSTPEFTRRQRGEQFLFVNGRYVKSRYLSHAVKVAYGDMLPDGAFPFFALFLDIDPEHVDINVHPTKAEVKFDDESGVYGFLRSAVKRGLGEAHLTPQVEAVEDDKSAVEANGSSASPSAAPRSFTPTTFSPPSETGKRQSASSSASTRRSGRSRSASHSSVDPGTASKQLYEQPSAAEQEEDRERDLLWQVEGGYILTGTEVGLMLVDQQAAHARVLYEKARRHLQGESGPSQQLLFPSTVSLNPANYALFEELLPELRKLGFELEPMSGRSVVVRGIPADMEARDEQSVLEEILESYRSEGGKPDLKGRDRLARSLARKGAVRSNEKLEEEAMRSLLEQLFACEMPYAGPEGEPTIVKIPVEELDKRFNK